MTKRCKYHGKEAFKARRVAINKLARYATRSNSETRPLRAYQDPACGFWHLTSKPL